VQRGRAVSMGSYARWALLAVVFALVPLPGVARGHQVGGVGAPHQLAAGVVVARLRLPGPARVTIVRLNPAMVAIRPAFATRELAGYDVLRRVAAREHALVAIDGDLSNEGRPAHAVVRDGSLLTTGSMAGAVIALDRAGTRASVTRPRTRVMVTRTDTGARTTIARWNAGPPPGASMAAFTGAYGRPEWNAPRVCAAVLAPTASGPTLARYVVLSTGCAGSPPRPRRERVLLLADARGSMGRWLAALQPGVAVVTRPLLGLPTVAQAFGGTPLLVHRGKTVSGPCSPLRCDRHPRAVVGLTRGCMDTSTVSPCRVLLVTVDGRRDGWSVGMTLGRAARTLVTSGAYEAINLDGGASAQLLLRGTSLNRPSPGSRRAVVSALIVRSLPRPRATGWVPRVVG
jgi:hypothetical protein